MKIILIFLCLTSAAHGADFVRAPRLPDGVTCDDVRNYVVRYGETFVFGMARIKGYSKRDISEARKCLR